MSFDKAVYRAKWPIMPSAKMKMIKAAAMTMPRVSQSTDDNARVPPLVSCYHQGREFNL